MKAKQQKKKKPQTLSELREVWYKKLERSGFDDIEATEYRLKRSVHDFTLPVVNRDWYAKNEYYSMAGLFLNSYKFKSNIEKVIFEYHANGISVRDIAKIISKARVLKADRNRVWYILKPLIALMKKTYLVKDQE